MNAFGQRIASFLENLAQKLDGRQCDRTLDAAFAAASEADLPAGFLMRAHFCCSCEFLLNTENFLCAVRDACDDPEDRQAIEELIAIERSYE